MSRHTCRHAERPRARPSAGDGRVRRDGGDEPELGGFEAVDVLLHPAHPLAETGVRLPGVRRRRVAPDREAHEAGRIPGVPAEMQGAGSGVRRRVTGELGPLLDELVLVARLDVPHTSGHQLLHHHVLLGSSREGVVVTLDHADRMGNPAALAIRDQRVTVTLWLPMRPAPSSHSGTRSDARSCACWVTGTSRCTPWPQRCRSADRPSPDTYGCCG